MSCIKNVLPAPDIPRIQAFAFEYLSASKKSSIATELLYLLRPIKMPSGSYTSKDENGNAAANESVRTFRLDFLSKSASRDTVGNNDKNPCSCL